MSIPLGPDRDELGDVLRQRVARYRGESAGEEGELASDEPAAGEPGASRDRPGADTPAAASSTANAPDQHEVFSIGGAFGGATGLVDSGLPSIVFIVTYTASGSDLRLAITLAVACGAVLAVLRLARRQSIQHAVGGFLGVAFAAYIASRSGKAEDFYLPGLYINAAYAVAYAVSIVVRWPLIGLLVAAMQQKDLSDWRRDPVLLRAYSRASWLWVGMFLARLAVQLPLYLASAEVPLGIARVAMGWPLFLVTAGLTYVVIKASVPASYRVTKLAPKRDVTTAPTQP